MFYSILKSPPNLAVLDDAGTKLISVDIATDDSRIVSVVSQLAPFVLGGGEEAWEFSFEIAVYSLDDGELPFQTQDREIAVNYIPADVRPAIMPVVCDCLNALIDNTKAPLVYMVTKDRDLPKKAMPKYHMLIEALEAAGYRDANSGTELLGRRYWTMQR